jgi:ABC-type nitrate/sulfonate/bicarbonate transport system permease component
MTEKIHSTAGYFLAGLAIGSLVGIPSGSTLVVSSATAKSNRSLPFFR